MGGAFIQFLLRRGPRLAFVVLVDCAIPGRAVAVPMHDVLITGGLAANEEG